MSLLSAKKLKFAFEKFKPLSNSILRSFTFPLAMKSFKSHLNELSQKGLQTAIIDLDKRLDKHSNAGRVMNPKGVSAPEFKQILKKGLDIKGDVKIFINITNDTELQRQGLNLVLNKTITLKEALCGFSFDLKYITGKIYKINNATDVKIITRETLNSSLKKKGKLLFALFCFCTFFIFKCTFN